MKKRIKFLVVILMAIMTISYLRNDKVFVKADETDGNPISPFSAYDYFNNLDVYYSQNTGGSCGYVALIMAMSYIDTFINDDIIPESYECKQENASNVSGILTSPGVLNQEYPEDKYNDRALYDFVQDNKDVDYQAYLMDLYHESEGVEPQDYSDSIGLYEYKGLVGRTGVNSEEGYYYTVRADYDHVDELGRHWKITDSDIRYDIDTYGFVILHLNSYYNGTNLQRGVGHAVVAYDYDENGIYANFGWGEGYTHKNIYDYYVYDESQEYCKVYGKATFDFLQFMHKHSDNYIVGDMNYCGCGHITAVTINYEDEGGESFSGTSNAPTKHINGTSTVLPSAYKQGYSFDGWYLTSDCSGTSVSVISEEYSSNITLYAKWSLNGHTTVIIDLQVDDVESGDHYVKNDVWVLADSTFTNGAGVTRIRIFSDNTMQISSDYDIVGVRMVAYTPITSTALNCDNGALDFDNGEYLWYGNTNVINFFSTSGQIGIVYLEISII